MKQKKRLSSLANRLTEPCRERANQDQSSITIIPPVSIPHIKVTTKWREGKANSAFTKLLRLLLSPKSKGVDNGK